jgi:ribonuclease PH
MRPSGRALDELRSLEIRRRVLKGCEGSVLISCGDTRVLCAATVEEKVPPFLKGKGKGWITAEYGMLPRSSPQRIEREAVRGRMQGRTQEIMRLIGRSLRSVLDSEALGERQIIVDCDVLQADGGTRCASITGAYIAVVDALEPLVRSGALPRLPLREAVAAVSVGLFKGEARLDLDYAEDSTADVDMNVVGTASGRFVEIGATAEHEPFSEAELGALMQCAKTGLARLFAAQVEALAKGGRS